jgi:hypothetical protein
MAIAATALLLLLATAACRTMPMPSYPPLMAAEDPSATRAAIFESMERYRWHIHREEPGQIDAGLNLRRHFLVVRISYDEDEIRTDYLESRNLECKPSGASCSRIHKAYDRWLRNLRRSIARAVSYSRSRPPEEERGSPVPL